MKRAFFTVSEVFLAIFLCALFFLAGGCRPYDQPGETAAEGHRRHMRVARINKQELMEDIDKVLLLDSPSKLTNKRIP